MKLRLSAIFLALLSIFVWAQPVFSESGSSGSPTLPPNFVVATQPPSNSGPGSTNATATPAPTFPPTIATSVPTLPSPTSTLTTTTSTATMPPTTSQSGSTVNIRIKAPSSGSVLKETQSVVVEAKINSAIDLSLQPKNSPQGSVYLGRAYTGDKTEAVFSWNTKNTPNGEYNLFANVIRQGDSTIILGPIGVIVYNPLTTSTQPVTATIVPGTGTATPRPSTQPTIPPNQTPRPSGSILPTNPTPIPSLSPKEQGSISQVEDIVFPSEFDPNTTPSDKEIKVQEIKNTKVEQTGRTALTFTGKATPNTFITLLIFSNPIVVTVKTDANGVWTYDLEKPLTGGKHIVYAVVPKKDGGQVRSEVSEFFIAPALAASENNESLNLASAPQDSALKNFAIASSIIVLFGLATLLLLFKFKKAKQDPLIYDAPTQDNN